jgi:hypothetical protein
VGTSILGHYARFSEALIDTVEFADAGLCRRGLNNLNHLADQRGQTLVNWTGQNYYGTQYVTTYEASPVVDTYYEMWRSTTFDISVREDGESYRCRTRLLVTSNHATYAANVAAVLSWDGANDAAELARDLTNVTDVTVQSASYAWTAEAAPDNLVYLTADQVARARASAPVINAVGGAALSGVCLRARLVVYANIANVAASARLQGVQLVEFYGA